MKITLLVRSLVFAASVCLLSLSATAQVTIGPGIPAKTDLGITYGRTYLYFETFTATAPGQILNSLTITLNNNNLDGSAFTIYIADWTGKPDSHTSGALQPAYNSILWQKDDFQSYTPNNTPLNGFGLTPKTYSNINIPLDPLKTYTFGISQTTSNGAGIGVQSGNPWSGGKLYSSIMNADLSQTYWDSYTYYDISFSMVLSDGSLSAVPEPSIPGLALGLGGLLSWFAYRAKRKKALIQLPSNI